MGFLSNTWDSLTGAAQGEGAQKAGQLERAGMGEAQDYLKERDVIGNKYGDLALEGLGGAFTGDSSGQQQIIDRAKSSPMYASIMGQQQAGEQAILRNASATGGLRSGNASGALTDYGMQLEDRALQGSYDEQIRGMEGLTGQRDRNTAGIAGLYADMGASRSNQAVNEAEAKSAFLNNGLAIAGTVGSFYSDPRLKKNLHEVKPRGGHRWFIWDWTDEAEKKLGLVGQSMGVIATLVNDYMPEAIDVKEGYLTVNYDMLETS